MESYRTYERHEPHAQRLDRNLSELLGELRVALPGVQVLFAFLLVAPFNEGFDRITEFERKLYFSTLLCTALASILLIAPSVHHRIVFRKHDKDRLVTAANRLTLAGLTVLAIAMTEAVALITSVLFGTLTTVVTVLVVFLGFLVLWYLIPWRWHQDKTKE